jgi:hypothetical protein
MSIDLARRATIQDSTAMDEPHDVEYQDGIAYAVGKGGTFGLIDVRTPDPRTLGTLDRFENAQTVLPVGNYALVAADAGVHVVDCSDPTDPAVLDTASDHGLTRINGMARWGGTLFCACKGGFVHAVDISDLPSVSVVGRYDAATHGGLTSPHDVAVCRDHLVVPNQRKESTPKLGTVRVFDAETNALLDPEDWTPGSSVSAPTMQGCNRVVVRNPYLFVANNYGNTVTAIDAADLGDIRRLGEEPTFATDPDGLALAGDYLLAGAAGTVEAFDVSDPTDPVSADIHHFEENIGAHDLEVVGNTVYVTGQFTDEIHVLSLRGESGSGRLDALYVEGSANVTDLRAVRDGVPGE